MIALLVWPFVALAQAACPDLAGHYREEGPFEYIVSQRGCAEVEWLTKDAPDSPNPPSPPSTQRWIVDCQKRGDFYQKESVCWRENRLEHWAYARNRFGQYVPISIRRLQLEPSGLLDQLYLTDSSGQEKLYSSAHYHRQSRP